MKAGLLKAPNTLDFEHVGDPSLRPGDMLVRVRAATVCGTDIRIFRGRKTAGIRYPSIIGHEFSGEVVDTGGHGAFSCGEAVSVCPAIPCGHCGHCKRGYENICQNLTAIGYEIDGAFAEYIRIPERAVCSGNVYKLPKDLSWEKAALIEPLACVLNGQERISLAIGDRVVVLGCGPIGLLHVKLARLSGAQKIIVSEPSPVRRAAALAAGADLVVDPAAEDLASIVRAETEGLGADKVIIAIGVPRLVNDALAITRHRGAISLFAGFSAGDMGEVDINRIHYHEVIVTGSFGLDRFQFEKSLALIASNRMEVQSMLTHRFGLEDIRSALETAERGDAIKVAIIND